VDSPAESETQELTQGTTCTLGIQSDGLLRVYPSAPKLPEKLQARAARGERKRDNYVAVAVHQCCGALDRQLI